MSTLEIIAGIVLILACIIITAVVMVQDSKEQGLTSAIGGGSNSSFYEDNKGRTRDAQLNRATTVSAVILFVIALAVNIISALH